MDILEGLNDRQYEAVTNIEGPMLVLAGAGSGKTKVLTHRIAYILQEKEVKPWNILAITFTNKAANEMKERILKVVGPEANDIWIGTFHSICVRILRRYIDKIGYTSNFNIYDTNDTKVLIKECIKELNLDIKMYSEKSVQSVISKAKSNMIDSSKYSITAKTLREQKIAEIYEMYQKKLKQNNGVDFDDIILCTIYILQNNADVLEYYQEKFKYILVDEYQDTNKPQFILINLLSKKYNNIFVVGDNDQSIYAFRGADISNILNFEKDYPGAKTVKLEQNYRSTQQILDVANCVIKNNETKISKVLWCDKKDGIKPVYNPVENQFKEAQFIADTINELVRASETYNDNAILYRTNAQSRIIEEIFLKERIPYKVIGGMKFYDRKEIKDIIAYLRVIENPSDSVSLRRIINEPKRGIGETTIAGILDEANKNGLTMFEILEDADKYAFRSYETLKDFAKMIKDFREIKDNITIEDLIKRVIDVTGYKQILVVEDTDESRNRIENIEELVTTVQEFSEESADNTLAMFLESISLISDLDNLENEQDYVVLMTIHNAKGLEFKNVFIVGVEEGIFPSYQSLNEDGGIEEERRLCYVAVTRAKEKLYIISARTRTIYGNTSCNEPSRFIKEINSEYIEIMKKEPVKIVKEYNFNDGSVQGFRSADVFLNSLKNIPTVSEVDISKFRVGQKVSHRKFGIGIIKSIQPEDDDYKMEIDFEVFGLKRLMANFARLEIIN